MVFLKEWEILHISGWKKMYLLELMAMAVGFEMGTLGNGMLPEL